ncbi:MAG: hypothetical protein HC828_07970 [Blastochloris sp.]|nr:hypothetical protein [Blastochloris sp.]
MEQDGVNVAFSLILGELENVIKDLDAEGAQAFQRRAYEEAQRLSRTGSELAKFQDNVRELQLQWINGFDTTTRERTQVERMVSLSTQTRGPRMGLRVIFPNGKTLRDSVAAQTFLKAIEEMGVDRVKALNLKVNNHPLISYQENDRYNQHQLNGYYVMTHSSTDQKKRLLEEMARRLNIKMKIEVV